MEQPHKGPDLVQQIIPRPAVQSYTPAERMMVTLQSDLARVQAELDDVRAQANLAMVWPKMGGVVEADEDSKDPWVLDYSLNADLVSLTSGHVFWGTKTMAVAAYGPVAVTDGICWGIEISYSAEAWGAAWVSKAAITDFVDTDSVMRQFYYKFTLAGAVASIALVGKRGNWKIPSVFAPE